MDIKTTHSGPFFFSILTSNLCILIAVFIPFTFKVIIDMLGIFFLFFLCSIIFILFFQVLHVSFLKIFRTALILYIVFLCSYFSSWLGLHYISITYPSLSMSSFNNSSEVQKPYLLLHPFTLYVYNLIVLTIPYLYI